MSIGVLVSVTVFAVVGLVAALGYLIDLSEERLERR